MRYKALLFDADGTLYDFKASEEYALSHIFASLDIPYTEEYIKAYHEGNRECWKEYEDGSLDMETLKRKRFDLFFDRLGLPHDGKDAGYEYIRLLGEAGILIPGAEDFLSALHGKKDMYIITNGIAYTQHHRIEGSGTGKYYKNIFISEEIGKAKPDPLFFSHVLSSIGIGREEAIVIGDSERSDIQGARNAGIRSVYISFDGSNSSLADHCVHSYSELLTLIDDLDK